MFDEQVKWYIGHNISVNVNREYIELIFQKWKEKEMKKRS